MAAMKKRRGGLAAVPSALAGWVGFLGGPTGPPWVLRGSGGGGFSVRGVEEATCAGLGRGHSAITGLASGAGGRTRTCPTRT